ncbi:phospholipase, partial [bacterium]
MVAGALRNVTYRTAGMVIRTAVSPVQKLLNTPGRTHNFCNLQAQNILHNDGLPGYARIVEEFQQQLEQGVNWADEGLKNTAHFYLSDSEKGLPGCWDASVECERHWQKAVQKWKAGNYERAFYYLGAAVHLVQDLCVPHHAWGFLFDGHQEYEDWAEAHCDSYQVCNRGIYELGWSRSEWVRANAQLSRRYMPLVRHGVPESDYHRATAVLLPRAQRTTAGFIACFLSSMGIVGN